MSDSTNYKIIQTVASGGTAVLYKAVQTSLDRVVAVKRLHNHLTDDETFTRRFILEAKAAASLDHANIVRVIDFGREGDAYQMVMEFIEGEALKEVLERWRPLQHDIALAVVHQICLGLEHAHAKGIVHRDIKPGNLMLTTSGKVKIADFGLAKLTQSNTSQTAANSILGTPLYMSPEQAFGESVDHRSDLFSLGTVLYELLTGRQPFASENYMGVIQNIINGEIPGVRDYKEDIPEEIADMVDRALSKERSERFQSAREFRLAIEEYLGIVQLNALSSRLTTLLQPGNNTAVMEKIPVKPRPRKRKSSKGGAAALVMFSLVAIGAAVLITNPAMREQAREYIGIPEYNSPPAVQSAQVDAAPYSFDMSTLIPTQQDSVVEKMTEKPAADVKKEQPAVQKDAAEVTPPPPAISQASQTEITPAKETPKPKPEYVPEGFLSLNSEPPAEIWIDGRYRGDTPKRLTLRAGQHTVNIKHPRYKPYKETLKIVNNELSRRNIVMERLQGMISLATDEGAELFVDGKRVGRTPLLQPLKLEVGPHMLSISKSGFLTWSNEVTVEANQTLPLKIKLSPKY